MNGEKRILLLGGTGAMGRYLAPELAKKGYSVLITSRSEHTSDDPRIRYIRGNARQDAFFQALMREHYDAIVDFMIYNTESFAARRDTLLAKTDHYLFLSSYRVYADGGLAPLTETSPRLLDTVADSEYLKTDEYALTKARQEDLLHASGKNNYTVVRPAITYSFGRFQLGNLEADEWLSKTVRGEAVSFPEEILDKQTTMTWAGDVAKMIAALVLNEAAFGETYTASTAEHHSWREVIEFYRGIVDLRVQPIPTEAYIARIGRQWQVRYDRMFHRVVDNSKILKAAGMEQAALKPMREGLQDELKRFLTDSGKETARILNCTGRRQPSAIRRLVDCVKRGDLIKALKRRLHQK